MSPSASPKTMPRAELPPTVDAVLEHDRQSRCPATILYFACSMAGTTDPPVPRLCPAARGSRPRRPGVLAVGGELKNTFCLTDGPRAYLPGTRRHGDAETLRAFEPAVSQLSEIRHRPVRLAADLHPGYQTRSWAERRAGDRPLDLVQHHHAHVVSLLAEHGRIGEPVIGVSFDGTGYGCDQTIWGGEILKLGHDSHRFVRVGYLCRCRCRAEMRPYAIRGGWRCLSCGGRYRLDTGFAAGHRGHAR